MSNDQVARTIAALRDNIERDAGNFFSNADLLALCDAAERGMRADKRGEGTTHWDDCWRYHHECAVARIERMRCPPREPTDAMWAAGITACRGHETASKIWRAMHDAAPINEGGQDAAVGNEADARDAVAPSPPAPPSPDGDDDELRPNPESLVAQLRQHQPGRRADDYGRLASLAQDAANTIARLTAELAEARVDAERYRWLRQWRQRWEVRCWNGRWWDSLTTDGLDAAIDAGRKG